jgi:hypothetical protein
MNDELTGQLGSDLPLYAQSSLWLETESGVVQTEGESGLFELDAPARLLTLRWGHKTGPALAHLQWQIDNLNWDGNVRIGGMVEAIHLTELPGLETTIVVVHLSGRPLKASALPYGSPSQRNRMSYEPPDFLESLVEDVDETTTTWLVGDDSPLYGLVHDAMLNNLRVWFTGRLAEDGSGWDKLFALPLLLETVTLLAL